MSVCIRVEDGNNKTYELSMNCKSFEYIFHGICNLSVVNYVKCNVYNILSHINIFKWMFHSTTGVDSVSYSLPFPFIFNSYASTTKTRAYSFSKKEWKKKNEKNTIIFRTHVNSELLNIRVWVVDCWTRRILFVYSQFTFTFPNSFVALNNFLSTFPMEIYTFAWQNFLSEP